MHCAMHFTTRPRQVACWRWWPLEAPATHPQDPDERSGSRMHLYSNPICQNSIHAHHYTPPGRCSAVCTQRFPSAVVCLRRPWIQEQIG